MQVPRWRRNPWCCAASHFATINLQRASWLLLVRLNLGFILRETCFYTHHTFHLGFPTDVCIYAYQAKFLAPLPGRSRHAARGVSTSQSLYFVFVLLSFIYYFVCCTKSKYKKISCYFYFICYLVCYIKNTKKLVYLHLLYLVCFIYYY